MSSNFLSCCLRYQYIITFSLVSLPLTVPASITHISGNQTVNTNDTIHLKCSAEGHPAPSVHWIRASDTTSVSFPLTITGIKDEGLYRCIADNGLGNPANGDVFITVQSKLN